MKQIELRSRKFLSPTVYTLVDDEDYNFLVKFKWYARRCGGHIYAETKINGKCVGMHALLMPTDVEFLVIDHANRNGLDNQKGNLRFATKGENAANSKKSTKNTTGYRGVTYRKKTGQWIAQLTAKGVVQHLGIFYSAQEAAEAYNKAAFEAFGEFAKLNEFAKSSQEDANSSLTLGCTQLVPEKRKEEN